VAALPRLTATAMPEGLSAGEIDAAVKRIVGEGNALYSLDEVKLADLAPDLIVTQVVCDVCALTTRGGRPVGRDPLRGRLGDRGLGRRHRIACPA
jgi:iron complex transport system substrate-binding protein